MAELMKNRSNESERMGLFSDSSCQKSSFSTKLRLGITSRKQCDQKMGFPFWISSVNGGAKPTVAECSAQMDLSPVKSSSNSIKLFPNQSGFGSPITVMAGLEHRTSQDDHDGCSGFLTSLRSAPLTIADEQSGSQLTIFYGGTVNVYEDIPADKAQAIMLMASSGNYTNYPHTKVQNSCGSQTEQKISVPVMKKSSQGSGIDPQPPTRRVQTDIPIARKYSLQRFLEKRKDRVNGKAKCPYKTEKADNPEHLILSPT